MVAVDSGTCMSQRAPEHRDPSRLLDVQDLTTVFTIQRHEVPAVRELSFTLDSGETLALVGESGSGKSVTALSLLGLIQPPGRIAAGTIRWRGVDMTQVDESELRRIRGREIGLILQDPGVALNPVFTVGDQLVETLRTHEVTVAHDLRTRMLELLASVGIATPSSHARAYPHQLSGGLQQRTLIALALAGDPTLLIADEPTTGLDALTQAKILSLLNALVQQRGIALLLISHDLSVVRRCADRVAIMYAGQIVETGSVNTVLDSAQHPYTKGLLASLPGEQPGLPLRSIEGTPPGLEAVTAGCTFAPRCHERLTCCDTSPPRPHQLPTGSISRCHLHES